MKKITFLIAFLTLTISLGQNLLSGGDLEGLSTGKIIPGSSPWDTSVNGTASQTSIINNSLYGHLSSNQFLALPNDFTNFRQPFTATANTQYTLKLWNQFISGQGQPASTDGIYISIRNNDGSNNGNGSQFSTPIQIYIDPSTLDANYNEFTLDFTAPQSNLLLFVTKQARGVNTNPNNAARMDDLSITEKVLSVKDLAQFNFNVSPNPAKDYINISAAKPINKIEVYNLLGQQVINSNLNSTRQDINVSNLSKGVYILKAFIEDATGTYKFVKE